MGVYNTDMAVWVGTLDISVLVVFTQMLYVYCHIPHVACATF